ncbi:MAG: hypothetical protein QOC58_2100 [Mycobacterium sp.]|nr:hypothetical protein [Mycobacterium sp.]
MAVGRRRAGGYGAAGSVRGLGGAGGTPALIGNGGTGSSGGFGVVQDGGGGKGADAQLIGDGGNGFTASTNPPGAGGQGGLLFGLPGANGLVSAPNRNSLNEFRRPVPEHHDGGVRSTAGDRGQDGAVDHPEVVDSMYATSIVDDGPIVGAHRRCAAKVLGG